MAVVDCRCSCCERVMEFLHSSNNGNPSARVDANPTKFCSVAYVPRVSEAIKRQIQYFIPEVTIANRPDNKLGQLYSKEKDKIDDMQTSDVVYQITCSCSILYIGETCQKACIRKRQHVNSVTPDNLAKPKTSSASALALHVKTTGHQFDFDSMKVLDRKSNKKKLQISEVNHIIMNKDRTCNHKQDTEHIAPAYSNLLRLYTDNGTGAMFNRNCQLTPAN